MNGSLDLSSAGQQPAPKTVVRLSTSAWMSGQRLCLQKTLTFLRRKSSGHEWVQEDVAMPGADEVLARVLNLSEVKDGIYVVMAVNTRRDWETGHLDSWDYKLVPFDPIAATSKNS